MSHNSGSKEKWGYDEVIVDTAKLLKGDAKHVMSMIFICDM